MTTEQHILPGGEVIEKAWNSTDTHYLAGAYPYLLDDKYYSEDEVYDYIDNNYSLAAHIKFTEFIRTLVDE